MVRNHHGPRYIQTTMVDHKIIPVTIVGGKLKESELNRELRKAQADGYRVQESIMAASRTTHLVLVKEE